MTAPLEKNDLPLIVTAAVIIKDEKALITRRPKNKPQGGLWEFPGGKLEPGESPSVALQRELTEELDIKIEVGSIIDAIYYRYLWGPVLILAYHCTLVSGTPSNIEVDEHRWVSLDKLHQYDFLPADKPLIKQLKKLA